MIDLKAFMQEKEINNIKFKLLEKDKLFSTKLKTLYEEFQEIKNIFSYEINADIEQLIDPPNKNILTKNFHEKFLTPLAKKITKKTNPALIDFIKNHKISFVPSLTPITKNLYNLISDYSIDLISSLEISDDFDLYKHEFIPEGAAQSVYKNNMVYKNNLFTKKSLIPAFINFTANQSNINLPTPYILTEIYPGDISSLRDFIWLSELPFYPDFKEWSLKEIKKSLAKKINDVIFYITQLLKGYENIEISPKEFIRNQKEDVFELGINLFANETIMEYGLEIFLDKEKEIEAYFCLPSDIILSGFYIKNKIKDDISAKVFNSLEKNVYFLTNKKDEALTLIEFFYSAIFEEPEFNEILNSLKILAGYSHYQINLNPLLVLNDTKEDNIKIDKIYKIAKKHEKLEKETMEILLRIHPKKQYEFLKKVCKYLIQTL